MSRSKPTAAWTKILPLLALSLALSGLARAVADPLTLEQALQGLEEHPRLSASPDIRSRLPRRQSLYLDCRRLAFANGEIEDADPRPWTQALLEPLAVQRLEVMERFFDVLLADLSFATESEAMAVAYVQYDRAVARQGLGQVSELRVLELETVYQNLLHRRAASEIGQQLTRTLLAQSLGRPEDLPRNLAQPTLPELPADLPSRETLFVQALEGRAIGLLDEALRPSDRRLVELEVRQQVTELLLRLSLLDAAERSLRAESAWRDLKLDESRALYELEVTADLGYSMSQQTRTRMLEHRIDYCRTLAWAELHELIGQPLWPETAGSP